MYIYCNVSKRTTTQKYCNKFYKISLTGIFIEEKFWDTKTEQISPKRYVLKDEYKEYLNKLNEKLNALTSTVIILTRKLLQQIGLELS